MTADADPLLQAAGLSADQLAELLGLVTATDITELDITLDATRVSLRRPATVSDAAATHEAPLPQREPLSLAIASPLVGIFHPSVSVGGIVESGQPIGAVEALGMPTTVDAPHGGTVEELLVTDGSPVEYGQPLLILRRNASTPL